MWEAERNVNVKKIKRKEGWTRGEGKVDPINRTLLKMSTSPLGRQNPQNLLCAYSNPQFLYCQLPVSKVCMLFLTLIPHYHSFFSPLPTHSTFFFFFFFFKFISSRFRLFLFLLFSDSYALAFLQMFLFSVILSFSIMLIIIHFVFTC